VLLANEDLLGMLIFLVVFLGLCGLALLMSWWLNGDKRRALARLRGLSPGSERPSDRPGLALSALPKLGALLVPASSLQQERLRKRLIQAGYYGPQAPALFLAVRLLLALICPLLAAGLPWLLGVGPVRWLMFAAVTGLGAGLLVPGLWLDAQRRRRLKVLRQGLPDALDMLVLCVEGGVSLNAALQRVTAELRVAYPLLGAELDIAMREMQLGLSAGEAITKLGDRCDLEELRQLGAMLLQSERFGTSVVKALRIYGDTCRQERQQYAEELAQKAAVKILFPTLLCIFPAIFVVVLGPAAFQIAKMFAGK
jgi:tight adherence protein C